MGDEAMLWELFEAVWARTGVRPRILAGERPPDEEVDRVLETLVEGLLGFPEVLLESLLLEWRHKARLLQEQGGIPEADAYFVVALGQHQLPQDAERQQPVPEELVVEASQVEAGALLGLHVTPELEQHLLAERIDHIARVEGATLGLAAGAALLEHRLFTEHPHALLH